jgi:hypothetical protein
VLDHFRTEGAEFATSVQDTKSGLAIRPWRKVLSDIDDTLKCSGGHYPAGLDRSLPAKAIYPGVLALFRELDLGSNTEDEWPTVLSARHAIVEKESTDGGPRDELTSREYDDCDSPLPSRSEIHPCCGHDVGNLVFLSARPHLYSDW